MRTSIIAAQEVIEITKAQIRNLLKLGDITTGTNLTAEMSSEHVQVYGNVAILSYSYMGMSQDKDGTIKQDTAKSTRVYVRTP